MTSTNKLPKGYHYDADTRELFKNDELVARHNAATMKPDIVDGFKRLSPGIHQALRAAGVIPEKGETEVRPREPEEPRGPTLDDRMKASIETPDEGGETPDDEPIEKTGDRPPLGVLTGDKDPDYVEWMRDNEPEEYQRIYRGRKTHLGTFY